MADEPTFDEIAEAIAERMLVTEIEVRRIRDSMNRAGISEKQRENLWPTRSPTPSLLKAIAMRDQLTKER